MMQSNGGPDGGQAAGERPESDREAVGKQRTSRGQMARKAHVAGLAGPEREKGGPARRPPFTPALSWLTAVPPAPARERQ